MVEQGSELAAILLEAMRLERDGHAFYLAAADRTEAAAGKKMFLTLARDELQHLEMLDRAYRSWVAEGRWPAGPELPPVAGRRLPVFPEPSEAAQVVAPYAGDLEALQRGIAAEEASIALYQQGCDASTLPAARDFYAFLVQQEEGHRTILQGEYDYLSRSGFWFDVREFDLESMG